MSAPESLQRLKSENNINDTIVEEEPITEAKRATLRRLSSTSPPTSSGPVIAVDLDDVLSQTNAEIASWHNETYGTNMTVSDFYYYYYWKNPMWGTMKETFDKVNLFYTTDRIFEAKPVVLAREGVQTLKNLGYRLIIVTARGPDTREKSFEWVQKHFPNVFDSIICTGQFKDAMKTDDVTHEVVTKLSKAQVCTDLGATLLIDDSAENAVQVCTDSEPTPVLLFGDYEWNKRRCSPEDSTDEMSFDRRLAACGGKEFWKEETVSIPDSASHLFQRVKDWPEAVRWVKARKAEGKM